MSVLQMTGGQPPYETVLAELMEREHRTNPFPQMVAGVLPYQTLQGFIECGVITGISTDYVNPASIDLPLSAEAYRVEYNFLPVRGEIIRTMLSTVGATRHDLAFPLEVGVTYLVRIDGRITLPKGVYGYANPKSSTGRNNVHVTLIADGVDQYDSVLNFGVRNGELWVLITPGSYPVKVSAGLALNQLRLFNGTSFLSPVEILMARERYGLFFTPDGNKFARDALLDHRESFFLSLRFGKGRIGWECRGVSNRVLDMTKIDYYQPEEFFEPVYARGDTLDLRMGSFYILSTDERVLVPPNLSAELRAMDPRMGEFRAHTAGYIDPGWGWGGDVPIGNPITLEFVIFKPIMIRPTQNVVRIRFERMFNEPNVHYTAANSNYIIQNAAKLSKHFKSA